jgi:hypothetical protein
VTTQLELSDLKIDWCNRMAERVLGQMRGKEFTSDDLHPILEQPAHENWHGILLAKMCNTGLIERTGSKPSTRPERNGGWVGIWKLKE